MQATQKCAKIPDLSVMFPVHNEEAVIDTLIERIFRASSESFEDRFEVILVNDGSIVQIHRRAKLTVPSFVVPNITSRRS